MPGTLFVVATPIGNLEDISARALTILRRVAIIAAEDTRRTAKLLSHYGIPTPATSLHAHNEQQKMGSILARLSAGDEVALVSDAGTPTISDPGQQLIRAAIDAGVRVEAVPGASAIMAALASSGLPAEQFTFLGFPPPKGSARRHWFTSLSASPHTVVFFEAPHRIVRTLEDLRGAVGDVSIVVGRELTKVHEELVRGPISEILSRGLRAQGEFTVVVDIGHSTKRSAARLPSDEEVALEFGRMANTAGTRRREVISLVAKRLGLSSRDVYSALERTKNSVE